MKKLTVEILPDKSIHAKWECAIYNEQGQAIGYGLPERRALSPNSLIDRQFVESEGGELQAYAAIAWQDIPYPEV